MPAQLYGLQHTLRLYSYAMTYSAEQGIRDPSRRQSPFGCILGRRKRQVVPKLSRAGISPVSRVSVLRRGVSLESTPVSEARETTRGDKLTAAGNTASCIGTAVGCDVGGGRGAAAGFWGAAFVTFSSETAFRLAVEGLPGIVGSFVCRERVAARGLLVFMTALGFPVE